MWQPKQNNLHINLLELMAIYQAIVHFLPKIINSSLLILTDNTTALAYVKNQGGTHSLSLFKCADNLLTFCAINNILVQAQHIPGKLNIRADSLSHSIPTPTEWHLNPSICQTLFTIWNRPLVDLLATRLKRQLPIFVSLFPDNLALNIDALSISRVGMSAYLKPQLHYSHESCQRSGRRTAR